MRRVRTQKSTIRRGRSWPEILPADPRDPDVVRVKTNARAHPVARLRRMRELADLSLAGGLPGVFLPGNGLCYLEGDLP